MGLECAGNGLRGGMLRLESSGRMGEVAEAESADPAPLSTQLVLAAAALL